MKRIVFFFVLFILCGAFLFASADNAVAPQIAPDATDLSMTVSEEQPQEIIYNLPVELYTSSPEPVWSYIIPVEILEDPNDVIRLVNKFNLLDEKYPPNDEIHRLVDAKVRKTSSGERLVREPVNDALQLMFQAAEADGTRLYLHSAYRSFRTQRTVYENNLKRYNGRDLGIVQSPGASEHQTGLGVDVLSREWIGRTLNSKFAQTKEAQWMANNCARFGFIIRYPEGKEEITGIIFEPWHLRYVGIEVASHIMSEGLTLEEFTEEWRAELYAYTTQIYSGSGSLRAGEFVFTEDED